MSVSGGGSHSTVVEVMAVRASLVPDGHACQRGVQRVMAAMERSAKDSRVEAGSGTVQWGSPDVGWSGRHSVGTAAAER